MTCSEQFTQRTCLKPFTLSPLLRSTSSTHEKWRESSCTTAATAARTASPTSPFASVPLHSERERGCERERVRERERETERERERERERKRETERAIHVERGDCYADRLTNVTIRIGTASKSTCNNIKYFNPETRTSTGRAPAFSNPKRLSGFSDSIPYASEKLNIILLRAEAKADRIVSVVP